MNDKLIELNDLHERGEIGTNRMHDEAEAIAQMQQIEEFEAKMRVQRRKKLGPFFFRSAR